MNLRPENKFVEDQMLEWGEHLETSWEGVIHYVEGSWRVILGKNLEAIYTVATVKSMEQWQ